MGARPKTEGGAGAAPPTVAAAPNGVNDDDGMNDAGVKAGCDCLWEGEGKKKGGNYINYYIKPIQERGVGEGYAAVTRGTGGVMRSSALRSHLEAPAGWAVNGIPMESAGLQLMLESPDKGGAPGCLLLGPDRPVPAATAVAGVGPTPGPVNEGVAPLAAAPKPPKGAAPLPGPPAVAQPALVSVENMEEAEEGAEEEGGQAAPGRCCCCCWIPEERGGGDGAGAGAGEAAGLRAE